MARFEASAGLHLRALLAEQPASLEQRICDDPWIPRALDVWASCAYVMAACVGRIRLHTARSQLTDQQ